jgi:hypothetical protein
MADSRFFFSTPAALASGSTAYVLVSPGHYGRNIGVAVELTESLRTKLSQSGINFTDPGNEEAEIEIGNTIWDKRVMRVKVKINMELPPDQAKQALTGAGFCPGLPTCF